MSDSLKLASVIDHLRQLPDGRLMANPKSAGAATYVGEIGTIWHVASDGFIERDDVPFEELDALRGKVQDHVDERDDITQGLMEEVREVQELQDILDCAASKTAGFEDERRENTGRIARIVGRAVGRSEFWEELKQVLPAEWADLRELPSELAGHQLWAEMEINPQVEELVNRWGNERPTVLAGFTPGDELPRYAGQDKKELKRHVMRLFDGVAPDLGISDPSDDGFEDYALDKMSDAGYPDDVALAVMSLVKRGALPTEEDVQIQSTPRQAPPPLQQGQLGHGAIAQKFEKANTKSLMIQTPSGFFQVHRPKDAKSQATIIPIQMKQTYGEAQEVNIDQWEEQLGRDWRFWTGGVTAAKMHLASLVFAENTDTKIEPWMKEIGNHHPTCGGRVFKDDGRNWEVCEKCKMSTPSPGMDLVPKKEQDELSAWSHELDQPMRDMDEITWKYQDEWEKQDKDRLDKIVDE